jgi:hypothetical protein
MIYLNKKLDSDSFENMTLLFYDAKESAWFVDLTSPKQISDLSHYN